MGGIGGIMQRAGRPKTHQVRLGSLSGTQSAISFFAAASSMAKSPKPSAVPVGAEADALHATGALVAKPLGLTHASRLS